MRGLAVLVALPLALAACAVSVEGAPCRVAGTAQDCPSGQACGNDGTCSERAAACAAPGTRCTPGETRCAGANGKELAETCTSADPACGTWVATPCASLGLECGTRSAGGAAACECPSFSGPALAADPVAGSPSGAAPFPTGAASPSACRFRRLGDALASAGTLAASGPVTVRAYRADASQLQVVFGAATSGDGPVAIPANVTVIGAADAAATILRAPAAAGQAVVTLAGVLQGFEIDAAGAGTAVATSCGGGVPALTGVAVNGGGTSTVGVDVSGGCGAVLTGVDVANVAGPALQVRADASAQVGVHGGSLRSSHVGALVTGGKVTLGAPADPSALDISGNRDEGVLLESGTIDAQLSGAKIHDNGGTGVVVYLASAGSAVALRGCTVSSNGTGAPRRYGASQRVAAGVLVVQLSLPFKFSGNQLYKNAGDQLVFDSADQGWTIAAAACGPDTNVFACVPASAWAVAANGGAVNAVNTEWPGTPVAAWVPTTGVTLNPYCNGSVTVPGFPIVPACP